MPPLSSPLDKHVRWSLPGRLFALGAGHAGCQVRREFRLWEGFPQVGIRECGDAAVAVAA